MSDQRLPLKVGACDRHAGSAALVSIVIPHFNRSELLRETLLSIEMQSYEHWEVLIVDDGSTDQHLRNVLQLTSPRVRVFERSDAKKGPSSCRNLGSEQAVGEYLLFLDSDDYLAPWCLSERMRVVHSGDTDHVDVFPVMIFHRSPGDSDELWNQLESTEQSDFERFMSGYPPWQTSSPLWRRDIFLRTGGFNPDVMYGDDSDLHLRALLLGVCFRKYPDLLPDVFIRRSETARITNDRSLTMLTSRMNRLRSGLSDARRAGRLDAVPLWESQYFREAEWFLFQVPGSGSWQWLILREARREFQSGGLRCLVVALYFLVAQLTRTNCFLALRVARRLAMGLLPGSYFDLGSNVRDNRWLPKVRLAELRERLKPLCMRLEEFSDTIEGSHD